VDPNDLRDCNKEVRLSELLTHADLSDKLDDMTDRELLEYALNSVHEQSVMVYLTHHYRHEVVIAFTGDSLILVDQSIPTQERIDAAMKTV
jgi:sulfur transfer protein SufE